MPEDKKAAVAGEAETLTGWNPTRREFIGKAVTVGAGMAIASVLPFAGETLEAQTPPCNVPTGETLVKIGQIAKPEGSTGPVQGVIKILNESKSYLVASKQGGSDVCETGQMRYLAGSLANGQQV